jgi:uncharacterized membrane protein
VDDRRIEKAISILLRGGVLFSAMVVLCGGILYLAQFGNRVPDNHVFHGEPTELRSVSGTIRAALSGRADGIIQLGLLLLILTPIIRVVISVVAFAAEHDYMYVIFTLMVLAVLLYSLTGA